MSIFRIQVLSIALTAMVNTSYAEETKIKLVGSDFMWPWIEEAVSPLTESSDTLDVSFSLKGSFPGLNEIRLNEANLGIIAVAPDQPVPSQPLVAIPVAYQVAYVLVHESNQLSEISKGRLSGIFGAEEETDYGQWGQLGLVEWEARTISPIIHAGDESLADSIFKYTVLNEPKLRGRVAEYLDSGELEEFLGKNQNAIAVTSQAPSEGTAVKALPIARDVDSPGYVPTPETVHFKDYEMSLPYYIVFPESARESVEPIVRFLLSDRFSERLEQEGFMPLPQRERQRLGITLGRE